MGFFTPLADKECLKLTAAAEDQDLAWRRHPSGENTTVFWVLWDVLMACALSPLHCVYDVLTNPRVCARAPTLQRHCGGGDIVNVSQILPLTPPTQHLITK